MIEGAFKLFIFDFDGVLASVDLKKALKLTQELGFQDFKIPVENIIQEYFYNNPKNIDLDLGKTSVFEIREEIREKLWKGESRRWHEWWALLEDCYTMSSVMRNFLQKLKKEHLRTAVMTDNHLDFRTWFNKRTDLSGDIDQLVCSAELGFKKPSLEILAPLWAPVTSPKTSVISSKEVVYFDDDKNNVESYSKLGIQAFWYYSDEVLTKFPIFYGE